MNTKIIVIALVAAGLIGAGGYGLYTTGMKAGMQMAGPAAQSSSPAPPAQGEGDAGKKVLYWHDPMVPGQKFDKPGKSPFMDMDLVPVYAGDAGDEGKVVISPRVEQNLGIRTAEVTKGNVTAAVEAVGGIAYNERDLALVQARSNGFVERLYVRAPLDPVKKGQPLVDVYIPDWVAAQEEYLSVKDMRGPGSEVFLQGARQRMRLTGMNDAQIRQVESSGRVQTRMTLTSPVAGVVTELSVREGMTVMAGAPLFRINGLDTVWVYAEIPEALAAQIRSGSTVEAHTPAFADRVLKGKVSALLPEVNAATRTLRARVEIANPEHRLVPGMFATINFSSASGKEVLMIPTEAVIQTGTRSVVMIAEGNGRFSPVDVVIGAESNGRTEIRKGLEAGQKVVVSGQFLIDSEASLRGTTNRMGAEPAAEPSKGSVPTHRGQGKVESIAKDEVTLSHEPIPSLQWGAMTMGFKLPASGLPANVKVGDSVAFELRARPDGTYEVVSMAPAGSAPANSSKEQAGTDAPNKAGGVGQAPSDATAKPGGRMPEGMEMKDGMDMKGGAMPRGTGGASK